MGVRSAKFIVARPADLTSTCGGEITTSIRRREGILFVSPWLRDGGVETALQTIVPWFARRRYRVECLSWVIFDKVSGHPNPVLETFRENSIPVRRLRGFVRLRLFQYAVRVAGIAARGRFRVLVGQELAGNVVAVLANLLLGRRLRVICSVHSASNIFGALRTSPALVGLGRFLYRLADGVVAPTEHIRQDAIEFFRLEPSRVVTVYYPFGLDRIRRLSAQQAVPDPAMFDPFILGCGRFVKMKGFRDLIRAFALVRARLPVKLVILGDGPDRADLVRCAEDHAVGDHVVLPGFAPNPFPYFARARAFVLSSRFGESFGRVLVEAMTCGTPIVSTRCQWGPEEVLGHGKYGLLYDVGDVEGLASGIVRILENPAEAAQLSDAARRRAEDFSAERIMPVLEEYYFGRGQPTPVPSDQRTVNGQRLARSPVSTVSAANARETSTRRDGRETA